MRFAMKNMFRQFKSGDFDLTDNERGIAGVIGWRPDPIATTIGTNTKCDPRSNLPTFKSHGKNPKVWKMGTTLTER